MEDKIYISHDQEGNVLGAFGFEPEKPFITIPSSDWTKFSVYNKEHLSVIDGVLTVADEIVLKRDIERKKHEYLAYLASTDWVEMFLIRHELGIDTIADDSNKLLIKAKRDEARAFLRSN